MHFPVLVMTYLLQFTQKGDLVNNDNESVYISNEEAYTVCKRFTICSSTQIKTVQPFIF